MEREKGAARSCVLVIGEPSPANADVLDALTSIALRVVVAREREVLRRLALGERPHAVLLLDCSLPDPEAFIACIRAHRGLERVPVMVYSTDGAQEPSPEDVAALVAASAATYSAGSDVAVESEAVRNVD